MTNAEAAWEAYKKASVVADVLVKVIFTKGSELIEIMNYIKAADLMLNHIDWEKSSQLIRDIHRRESKSLGQLEFRNGSAISFVLEERQKQ